MKLEAINSAVVVWGVLSQEALTQLKTHGRLVVVPEQRPSLVGVKHNAPLLKEADVAFVCCPDNALGLLFAKGAISKVMLLSESENKEGVFCLSGSLYVTMLAVMHRVEVSPVLGGSFSYKGDQDAATLEGQQMIKECDRTMSVYPAGGELVEWEVLQ